LRNIYTSIDIGSDTVKIIVCELFNNKINLLATSSTKSIGIKNGIITDIEEASTSVKEAIDGIETKLGIKIHDVIALIPSANASFRLINGIVNIKNDDDIITKNDIIKVLQSGMKSLEDDMEMVTILPISFTLDGVEVTKYPLNKKAKILESKAILVSTKSKEVYDVMRLMGKCGLEVVDISISGICDMCALRSNELDSKVGAIVNIGSDLTTVSIYNKGIIVRNKVIALGGKAIDNDLAYVYKTSMIEAKNLKERFSLASLKYASVSDIYDLTSEDGKIIKVNQHEVSEVAVARLEEVIRQAKLAIDGLASKDLDYIIFTGGVSNMPYLDLLIQRMFGEVAKIARINIVGVRNNKYSTSLGNVVYYINKQKLVGDIKGMVDSIDSLSSIKKNMMNLKEESMLGKVASYFFGE